LTWLWIAFLSRVRKVLIRLEEDKDGSREVAVMSDETEAASEALSAECAMERDDNELGIPAGIETTESLSRSEPVSSGVEEAAR
jgi:hypothetical protein